MQWSSYYSLLNLVLKCPSDRSWCIAGYCSRGKWRTGMFFRLFVWIGFKCILHSQTKQSTLPQSHTCHNSFRMPLLYRNIFQTRLFHKISIFAKAWILCFAFNVEAREGLWLHIVLKIPTDILPVNITMVYVKLLM